MKKKRNVFQSQSYVKNKGHIRDRIRTKTNTSICILKLHNVITIHHTQNLRTYVEKNICGSNSFLNQNIKEKLGFGR